DVPVTGPAELHGEFRRGLAAEQCAADLGPVVEVEDVDSRRGLLRVRRAGERAEQTVRSQYEKSQQPREPAAQWVTAQSLHRRFLLRSNVAVSEKMPPLSRRAGVRSPTRGSSLRRTTHP